MDGWVTIGTELNTKNFDAQIEQVQKKLEDVEATLDMGQSGIFKLTESEMVDLSAEAERLRNRLKGLKDQQDKLAKSNLVSVKKIMEDIGNSTGKVIKQVGRWTLAVFGVRAVYGFVRNAVSTLSQYNKQLATDLEYIRYAVAVSLQGAINNLIQLAYKLLIYIDYLANAWFGISLFANASAEAMKKGAGSAEKMRKSLQGFDEMNVVSDTSGGGSGGATPSVDLSKLQGIEPPEWLVKIKEIGQWILDNWEDVVGALLLTSMLINALTKNWIGFFAGLVAFAAVGIKKVIDSAKEFWNSLVEWWDTSGKEMFMNVLKGIGQTIKYLIQNFINTIVLIFNGIVAAVTAPFKMIADIIESIFNGIVGVVKGIINTIIKLFKGDFKGALNSFKSIFKSIMDSLWGIVKAPLNMIIGGINSLIKGMNKIKFDVPDWIPVIGGAKWGFNIKEIPRLAVGGIVNMPSRGVPIGGAIAGEAGAEGVIPLTNSQAMETLGQAIGKYVTINANITTNMNGRVISRELQKVNSSSDFARNV